MSFSESVDLIIDVYLGNPFVVSPESREAAVAALRATDVGQAARSLINQRQVLRAKQLVLAVGHYEACASPDEPSEVLGPKTVPVRVLAALPRRRGEYLRIVMAAGRCYRALCGLSGDSEPIAECRRKTWAACFGDSLDHALEDRSRSNLFAV